MTSILYLILSSNSHYCARTIPATNVILNLINHVYGLNHYSSKPNLILFSHWSHNTVMRNHSKTYIFERCYNTVPFSEINYRKSRRIYYPTQELSYNISLKFTAEYGHYTEWLSYMLFPHEWTEYNTEGSVSSRHNSSGISGMKRGFPILMTSVWSKNLSRNGIKMGCLAA
jgi:hypothetical protein